MSSTRNLRWWVLAATLWPVAMVTLSFAWPGPDTQEPLQRYFDKPAYDPASPPVDTTGASGDLTVSDAEGSARIFWTQPEKGKVKVTIEVPPENRDAGAPVPSRPR